MAHNCGALLPLPVKFVCSAVFESVEGDSLTQGVKMRFILMIDSKHFLLPGREGNFRDTVSLHLIFSFVWLPPRVTFPVLPMTLFIQCHSLDLGLLLITYKSVSGLDLSPGCSYI